MIIVLAHKPESKNLMLVDLVVDATIKTTTTIYAVVEQVVGSRDCKSPSSDVLVRFQPAAPN